jgi:hypothetical protein
VSTGQSKNSAIDCAIAAIKARSTGIDTDHLKKWRRVPVDAMLQRYGRKSGTAIFVSGIVLCMGFTLAMTILSIYCYFGKQAFFFSATTPYVSMIDSRPILRVVDEAQEVVKGIEMSYPPNATGWARILPWNWYVEPLLPESHMEVFERLKKLGGGIDYSNLLTTTMRLTELRDVAGSGKIDNLQNAVESLHRVPNYPPKGKNEVLIALILTNGWQLSIFIMGTGMVVVATSMLFWRRRDSSVARKEEFHYLVEVVERHLPLYWGWAFFFATSLLIHADPWIKYFPMVGVIGLVAIGWSFKKMRWSGNSLLGTVDDVVQG